ncbi:HD domain-containing protein [Geosporobacter ferrireducens]|uniref:HD domain-containing protein n=1 Tax=Geosporobacter ferrireducens TaxID=1424294 RepID=A0A1D8GNX5_9FIRM|nr:HD domain-containing protein [Geosporobacter ferrireducens]AOT72593.1 HD domain-containing protein [Geosporobacter ferrireducens]MTI54993.1 HD domain-containing protein [Geosporobacter ferrireducens]
MERVTSILNHPLFVEYMQRNYIAETDRVYCRHNLQHSIDVARVAYVMALEEGLPIRKDVIYATGLLHDIGRWKEYVDGISHAKASADLAEEILVDSEFERAEIDLILDAIRNHRKNGRRDTPLSVIIFRSDKVSRLCLECNEIEDCNRFSKGDKPKLIY